MKNFTFTATIVEASYNCPEPPNVQTGWVLHVDKYVEGIDASYPVGEKISWALGCFLHKRPEGHRPGDTVTVNYLDNDRGAHFTILPLTSVPR